MRVLWLIPLVMAVALGVTLAASGRSGEADVPGARTAFESLNGARWTSLPEERRFLRELDARSGRVTVSTIGRSVEGRPIRLVRVGRARTRAQIAAGRSVLLTCTQHGDEPAGREACLQAARGHAGSDDATTVLIVPTANPDGFAAGRRHNADGVDINRDHHKLATPEARALAAVIRDYRPDLLGDMHEYPWADDKVLLGDPSRLHLNADPGIAQLTRMLTDAYVLPALKRARFVTGLYPSSGGEADESVLRQQAVLRHVPTLLLETSSRGRLSPVQRVRAHRTAIGALLRLARERGTGLASTTAGAARRAAAEGATGARRYYFTSPSTYSDTPPCGYRLTDAQYRSVRRTLDLLGIAARPDAGSWTISTAQATQPGIGLLLDARAARELTPGERLSC